VITFLAPGLRFFHEGQLVGRPKRISPHLARRPNEPANMALAKFYEALLAVLRQPVVRDGRWQLLECVPAWDGNGTWDCFVAFSRDRPTGERLLAAVNYAQHPSQCYLRLPFADLGPATYDRAGSDLQTRGLYLDMPAWEAAVYTFDPATR
jgi:hypothetical protein